MRRVKIWFFKINKRHCTRYKLTKQQKFYLKYVFIKFRQIIKQNKQKHYGGCAELKIKF